MAIRCEICGGGIGYTCPASHIENVQDIEIGRYHRHYYIIDSMCRLEVMCDAEQTCRRCEPYNRRKAKRADHYDMIIYPPEDETLSIVFVGSMQRDRICSHWQPNFPPLSLSESKWGIWVDQCTYAFYAKLTMDGLNSNIYRTKVNKHYIITPQGGIIATCCSGHLHKEML